jgi:ATP-binding cassette subfamily B multidrug efflux pump
MIAISPSLTWITLLPLPLVSVTVWFFGERIHRRFEAIQEHFARLSARVQENLAGVRVVRAYARENGELDEFQRLNRDYFDRNLALIRTSGVFYPSLELLNGVAALLALWLGGRLVVAGRITLGEFVAFTWYLGMLSWPMVALGWVTSLFQRGLASWARIMEILDTAPTIADPPDAVRPDSCAGAIEIRHLTFTYPGAARPALRDVSLRIPAGHTLAIIGRTGAGKSTLVHMLPRLFDPPPGTVFLDGHDVRTLELGWLRRQIAIVHQDPFLFSATVAENIAYGVERAEPEEIERVAAIARLDAEVRGFPQGYDTRVGERGITLSGGQKQRVTIARALLRNSPLLLLDDCLSSVDAETEESILRALSHEMRRHTTLIVSHRVSAVRDADTIVVVEDGAIVEQGTHDELIALGRRYWDLAQRQQIEQELEAS